MGRSGALKEDRLVGPRAGRRGGHLEAQMADLPGRMQAWTEALVESRPPQWGQARVEA